MTGADTGQSKLREVRAYLERFFPGEVGDSIEQGEGGHIFRVPDPLGGVRHEVHVTEAFMARHPADQIQRALAEHKLFDVLRQAGTARVRVDVDGIDVIPPAGTP
jgi:hypothetical protein